MKANRNCPGDGVDVLCRDVYGYPAHFRQFHWWNAPGTMSPTTIDEIPIPALPNRYPYRYSSAGPCSVGRTKKELDMYRCFLDTKPKIKRSEIFDLKDIVQIEGYETSSMTASLAPFRAKRSITEFTSRKIPTGLNEPFYVPYLGHSEFDQFIIDSLYPDWRNDPLYKRRIIFRMDFFKPPQN